MKLFIEINKQNEVFCIINLYFILSLCTVINRDSNYIRMFEEPDTKATR